MCRMFETLNHNQKKALSQVAKLETVESITPHVNPKEPCAVIRFKMRGKHEQPITMLRTYGIYVESVDTKENEVTISPHDV